MGVVAQQTSKKIVAGVRAGSCDAAIRKKQFWDVAGCSKQEGPLIRGFDDNKILYSVP